MKKLSELLDDKNIPPFVLGAFLSRQEFKDDIVFASVKFKASTTEKVKDIVTVDDFCEEKPKYLEKINEASFPYIWDIQKGANTSFRAKLEFENDLKLTNSDLVYRLYSNIVDSNWIAVNGLTEDKKMFIRGFMETRGSIDTCRPLISQDYFYCSNFEAKKYRVLTDFCNVPDTTLNLNFRQLQSQYSSGERLRNTQFRINSLWYMKNIGMLNTYKAKVFAIAHSDLEKMYIADNVNYFNIEIDENISTQKMDQNVNSKFDFYITNILGRTINQFELNSLRDKLGFNSPEDSSNVRDSSLAKLIRELEPDECVCCTGIYNIQDRTFIHRKTDRPYFEIHHVISLNNTKELDDENNLVKLCPACHDSLKRSAAYQDVQKQAIGRILVNSKKALSFCENMFASVDRDYIIDEIYKRLK